MVSRRNGNIYSPEKLKSLVNEVLSQGKREGKIYSPEEMKK